MQFFAA